MKFLDHKAGPRDEITFEKLTVRFKKGKMQFKYQEFTALKGTTFVQN